MIQELTDEQRAEIADALACCSWIELAALSLALGVIALIVAAVAFA